MCFPTGIIFIFFISIIVVSCQSDIRVKAICTHSKSTFLNLACSNQSLILLKHAFYGKSQIKKCHHSENDCYLMDFQHYTKCNRQQHCQFTIHPIALPKCSFPQTENSSELMSDYYQMVYECIKKSTILNVCEESVTSSQNGLIVSPLSEIYSNRNDNNNNNTVVCKLTIDLSHHPHANNKISQNIMVIILDMKLDCATSYLQLSDFSGKFWKSCKLTRQSHVFTSITNKLLVKYQFNPNIMNENTGFWLSYRASPFIVYPDEEYILNACKKLSVTTYKSMKDNKFIQNNLYSFDKDKNMKKLIEVSNINHIIMLSVFIGILSLLLTVLSSVVLIKRYKICFKKSYNNEAVKTSSRKPNQSIETEIRVHPDVNNSSMLNCRSFQCQNQICLHERTSLLRNLLDDYRHCSICSTYIHCQYENTPQQPVYISHSDPLQNTCDI